MGGNEYNFPGFNAEDMPDEDDEPMEGGVNGNNVLFD
jgi:hypothetical protein